MPVGGRGDEGQPERRLTIARVRERGDYAEVTFYESARFYRLPRATRNYTAAVEALRAAAAKGVPLRIRFSAPNSDVIDSVRSDN